jgi:large subunit ribosomal protein L10
MAEYKSKVSPRNVDFANRIRELVKKYSIVGVVDVTGLPAPQFQRIRASLKKTAEILIVKRNLISLVCKELNDSFPGLEELSQKCSGVVGLVFTNDNPFALYKFIKKNKSSAPAKAGQIAPNDIVVPAGPTSFAPGPIIGELGALKIKAGINAGKVEIKENCVVAKEGDVISPELASILTRLNIEPMEVGLNLKAVVEAGLIYDKSVLDVDEDAILEDLKSQALRAFQLSVGLEYYTNENVKYFLGNAGRDSLALGVGIAWPEAETIKHLLSKANSQMSGVASSLPEDLRPAGVAVASVAAAPVAEESSSANEGNSNTEESEKDASAGLADLF